MRFVLQDTIVSAIWATLYLAAGHFLPQELRSWVSSTMSTSPGCGVLLILGFAATILGIQRFGHYLSRRRASRLGTPAPIASEASV
jgi:membrane protein DedA with SNARE-associated domain